MSTQNFKKINRRDFIKVFGSAASFAIPFLNSAVAMGQTNVAPTRLLLIPLQHGWGLNGGLNGVSSQITGTETNFTLPPPFNVFNSIKNQTVFVDNLRSTYWGNAHDVSYSDMFTCGVRFDEPSSSALGGPFPLPRSPSIDWMISNATGKNVLRLSHGYRSFGAAHHPLSFDNNLRSLPFYTSARDAFMGVIDPLRQQSPTTPTTNTSLVNSTLMNFLGPDANRLANRLGGAEKNKLQGYVSALQTLGSQILNSSPPTMNPGQITLPPTPASGLTYPDQLDQYLELIRVCFQMDTHRVAILGLSEGATDWPWVNGAGVPQRGNPFGSDFHHQVAHYTEAANPESRRAYEGWVTWYGQKIVNFVNRLAATPDVDGRPMIDNTIIVLLGEVGDGQHNRETMVYPVIGGGGAGRIRRGRWLNLPVFNSRNREGNLWASRDVNGNQVVCGTTYIPKVAVHHTADLWVSIGRLMGLNINSFGIDLYNKTPIQLT